MINKEDFIPCDNLHELPDGMYLVIKYKYYDYNVDVVDIVDGRVSCGRDEFYTDSDVGYIDITHLQELENKNG